MSNQDSSSVEKISFSFTKKISNSLTGNKLEDEKPEKDFVISVDDSRIESTQPRVKSQPLVIPLIKRNKWKVPDQKQNGLSEEENKLKDLAVQELLLETNEKNAEWENRDYTGKTDSIPLILQNKIPGGFETDDRMDVSLRAEESTLEDYDRIPVDQFGLAMLRGMGWKEGEAIGKNSTGVVKPVQVQLRPKGLGLGADASVLKKNQKKAEEAKLLLIKGAYVTIIQGQNKGFYAEVLSLDEENGRVIIKLSNNDKILTLPEFSISLVTKKEFDKESRIINRESYENYKREKEQEDELTSNKRNEDKHEKDTDRRTERKRSRSPEAKSSSSRKHAKKSKHKNKSPERESHKSKLWLRPQLRVRLIDDKYKKGKYFNKKLIVVDVLSSRICSCKTEENKYLDDISPSMLETVVPRDDSSYVMIVKGKYSGQLCTILKRDKSTCEATVQFLSDRDRALNIDYDAICEYVGDVSAYD